MIARFPKALVALFSLLPALLGGCQKQNDEGAAKAAASAAPQVAAPAPKTITPVRIGYQKIGAPFLLKSRSADLDKRLDEKSAKAEWKEFKHGPGVLEAIKAKEVDVGYVGETPPVFAQAGGVDFLYVASDPPAPKAEALIVRKDSPIKSLRDLTPKQQFHVLFYNHQVTPFNTGRSGLKPIPATRENIYKVESFVQSVQAFGKTYHIEPMEMAIKMKPDVIFLLTDGEEQDDRDQHVHD